MSITTTYCPSCGQSIEAEPGSLCAQCQAQTPGIINDTADAQLSFASKAETSGSPRQDLLWAFLVWGISGPFLLAADAAIRLVYRFKGIEIPKIEITFFLAVVTLVMTLIMQVVGLGASWMFVTRLGRKPFLKTLGWRWHPQFRWQHAVAGAMLMFSVAVALSKLLPHQETDMDKILKMGFVVRVLVAVLAVLAAPLVEEVIYRGVVYSTIERLGGKVAGVITVTAIFALVHVPQYWGSVAAITAIVTLSLVLTLLRAWTGSLLPCVVMHLAYNGIQAGILLVAPDTALDAPTQKTAMMLIGYWLGGN